MDIGIFIEYDNRVVQIPVNPDKFNVKTSGSNKTAEIISLGEVVIPRKEKLSTISWKSFFPYESWFPSVRTKGSFESAKFYVDFIKKIRADCKPCHLTVTGIGIDEDVVIESFEYYHQAGDHEDTYYSISLKKYTPYNVSILSKVSVTSTSKNASNNTTSSSSNSTNSTTKKTTSSSVGSTPSNSSVSVKAKDITVGCQVILNGRVHRDSYGSGPGMSFTNYRGKVNLINKHGSHPYHVTTPSGGWLGWVSKESVVIA